jgi:peptidoglycan hydrolase-like protein with peptidoglycan-binding domain
MKNMLKTGIRTAVLAAGFLLLSGGNQIGIGYREAAAQAISSGDNGIEHETARGLVGAPNPADTQEVGSSTLLLVIDSDDRTGPEDNDGQAQHAAGAIGDVEIIAPYPSSGASVDADGPGIAEGPGAGEQPWLPPDAQQQPWWPPNAQQQPWWPPKPPAPGKAGPDLAVQKVVPAKCLPGKACAIVVVVTNVGGTAYVSPVRIADDLPNAWTLVSTGPAGSLWTCGQAGTQAACTHPMLKLAPGKSEVLAFDIQIPAAQVPGLINNCARVEHGASGFDANPANDQGCTQLTFDGKAPVTPNDLAISKEAQGECIAGQPCLFVVRITNAGTSDYDGVVSYVDILPANWKFGATKPGWWCIFTVGGGDRFACWQQAKLSPGQSVTGMFILTPPAGTTGKAVNCAEIDWTKAPQDQHANNDRACAEVEVKAPPPNDLSIDKRFEGQGNLPPAAAGSAFVGGCQQGTACAFDVVITNNGPGRVDEVLTLNMIPNYGPASVNVTNCVFLDWSASKPDADPGNDRSCLPLLQAEGKPNLIIRKKGPEACERGKSCQFDVEIENIGTVAFKGPLGIVEEDDDIFEISSYASADPWTCKAKTRTSPAAGQQYQLQPGRIDCSIPTADLAPGQKTLLRLNLIISPYLERQRTHYKNCVKFAAEPDNDGVTEEGCHTVRLVPDWDLKITKTAPSMCYGLKTDGCAYAYAVTNTGPGDYEGRISIVDEYAKGIGLDLSGWSPQPPNGWDCKVITEGEWRCDYPTVKLKAGESLKDVLKLVMRFRQDTPADLEVISNRATVKYLGGPPDGNPDNDSAEAHVIINHSEDRTVTGTTQICSAFDIFLAIAGQDTTCYKSSIPPKLDVNGDGTVECRGPACTFYEFSIVNSGAINYTGDMRLVVTLPDGARFLSAKGSKSGLACKADQWSCGITGNKAICTPKNCILGSDEETAVRFDVKLLPTPAPAIPPQGMEMTTCAELTWDTPEPLNPIEQRPSETSISRACRTTLVLPEKPVPCPTGQQRNAAGNCVPIVQPVDLAITKRTVGNCDGKENCRFQITVRSQGNRPFNGGIAIRDTLSVSGAKLKRVLGQASCTQSGRTIECVAGRGALAAGRPLALSLDVTLPKRGGNRSLRNCAEIYRPGGGGSARLSREEVRMLQRTLDQLGYDPGPIDGVVGPRTRDAVRAARRDLSIAPGTQIDRTFLARLLGGAEAGEDTNPANDRSCVSVVLPACGPGYNQIRATGECVCVPPRQERNGACVIVEPTPTRRPPPQTVRCDNGSVNARNQCVCPPTWSRQVMGRNWYRCLCPEGTTEIKGRCRPIQVAPPPAPPLPPQPVCTGGKILVGNRCVCPQGTIDVLGTCLPIPAAPPPPPPPPSAPKPVCTGGQVLRGGSCICPPDRPNFINGSCQPPFQVVPPTPPKIEMIPLCPQGQKWVPELNRCVTIVQ